MGLNVNRYIEIYTPDNAGVMYDINNLKKLGKFVVGDIVLLYNEYNGYKYFKVSDINNSIISYEPIYADLDNIKTVSYICENYSDLPVTNFLPYEGTIYKCYCTSGTKYMKYRGDRWIEDDNYSASWKQIRWDKRPCISSPLTLLVSDYMIKGFGDDGKYAKRGLPNDVSNTIKDSIEDYEFNHTYVSLKEIAECADDVHNELKQLIQKHITQLLKDNNSDKIDYLVKMIAIPVCERTIYNKTDKSNTDSEYGDYFEEDLNDLIAKIESYEREYTKIKTTVEAIYDEYISDDNIRVIYTFDN